MWWNMKIFKLLVIHLFPTRTIKHVKAPKIHGVGLLVKDFKYNKFHITVIDKNLDGKPQLTYWNSKKDNVQSWESICI